MSPSSPLVLLMVFSLFFMMLTILKSIGQVFSRIFQAGAGYHTGAGCHFLLQVIFPPQGSNQHLLLLLNWQADSLLLCSLGNAFSRIYLSLSHVIYSQTRLELWYALTYICKFNSTITSFLPNQFWVVTVVLFIHFLLLHCNQYKLSGLK